MRQGEVRITDARTDVALIGEGLLVFGESAADRAYVRGGHFRIDDSFALVDAEGRKLQGYRAGTTGPAVNEGLHTVVLGLGTTATQTLTSVLVSGNLDARTPTQDTWFDPDDPEHTSAFAMSLFLGENQRPSKLYFSHTTAGAWTWNATTNVDADCAPLAKVTIWAWGSLSFDAAGNIKGDWSGGSTWWNLACGGPPERVDLNIGPRLRQDASSFSVRMERKNGRSPVGRTFIDIDRHGAVLVWDGGVLSTVAHVPVVLFRDFSQLATDGVAAYYQTSGSGPPVLGLPGDGHRADVLAGAIESLCFAEPGTSGLGVRCLD